MKDSSSLFLVLLLLLVIVRTPLFASEDDSGVDLRVRAYQELLKRPAPEGLSLSVPEELLTEAEAASINSDYLTAYLKREYTERWLASQSKFIWLTDRVGYLNLAADILGRGKDDAQALANELEKARHDLNTGKVWGAEIILRRVDEILQLVDESVAGGKGKTVLPANHRVMTTWLKIWRYAGYAFEPNPLSIRWLNGSSIIFSEKSEHDKAWYESQYASDFTSYRTWTGNTWKGPGYSLHSSVLSPITILDLFEAKELSFSVPGTKSLTLRSQADGNSSAFIGEVSEAQAVVIECDGGNVLLMPDSSISIKQSGDEFTLRIDRPCTIAAVALPASANIGESVQLWSRIAAAPPVEVVQTYDEDILTLHYVHAERKHVDSVAPLKVAPVPSLLQFAASSGWEIDFGDIENAVAPCEGGSYNYKLGDKLSVHMPPVESSGLHGANLALYLSDVHSYKELAWRGATTVRLLVREEEIGEPLAQHLTWCRENGLKVNVDLHFKEIDAELTGTDESRRKWADTWKRVAEVCRNFTDTMKCYDIGNEPLHDVTEEMWLKTARECIKSIRSTDSVTPILVEAAGMADYRRLHGLLKLEDDNLIYGVHIYLPLHYTYGRYFGGTEFGHPQVAPFKFYPGWAPPVNWEEEKEGWFGGIFQWFDTWELLANLEPMYKFRIQTDKRVDVGEFGVCGHNNVGYGQGSAVLWLRDMINHIERCGASWDFWSYNWGGFSWEGEGSRLFTEKWRELNKTSNSQKDKE